MICLKHALPTCNIQKKVQMKGDTGHKLENSFFVQKFVFVTDTVFKNRRDLVQFQPELTKQQWLILQHCKMWPRRYRAHILVLPVLAERDECSSIHH